MLSILSKFLNRRSQKISSAALTVAFFGLISRFLGLWRDRILAGHFGAGQTLDIYYTAFKIPDLLYSFLIAGSISAAFLPVFHEYLMREKKEAWHLANLTLNFLLLTLAFLSAMLIFFTPQLIYLVAPGFSAQARSIAVEMSRLMFLSTLFLGLSSLISSLLQAFSRFLITSLAPIFYNLGIIFGILFFVPRFGISGLAYGVILGATAHFFIQLPALFAIGFKWRPALNFYDPGIKKIAKLWLPTLGLAALQLNSIVITAIASFLAVGSIAVFNLSDNLRSVPFGIIGVAFSTAAFPAMSLAFAKGNNELFLKRFSLAVKQTLFVVIPVSFFFFMFRAQIVRLILGTGQFNWQDTQLTAASLGLFAFSIFASSLLPLFTRGFYVLRNTVKPVVINISSMAINILLSIIFVVALLKINFLNHALAVIFKIEDLKNIAMLGLPLSVTVAAVINLAWHWIDLKKSAGDFGISEIKKLLLKIIFASIAGSAVIYASLHLFSRVFYNGTTAGLLLQTLAAFLLGSAAYLFISFLIGIEDSLMFNIKGTLFNWRDVPEPEPKPTGDTLDDQY